MHSEFSTRSATTFSTVVTALTAVTLILGLSVLSYRTFWHSICCVLLFSASSAISVSGVILCIFTFNVI